VLAFIPITLTWVELRREQRAQREQTQKEIMDTYDRMIEYRLQRPEVLGRARRWEHKCFDWIYDHGGPDGDAWAVYYGYIERIIAYATSVLYAHESGTLDQSVYRGQHERLIRLLLAEHYREAEYRGLVGGDEGVAAGVG